MATDGERDTSRTSVRTYVPTYQRDEWDAHADELDMSRSEFVRTMVQAGRRGFDEYVDATATEASPGDEQVPSASTEPVGAAEPTGPTEADGTGRNGHEPQGSESENGLEERVVELLREDCKDWDELFDALTADIEDRLETTLQSLQSVNRVQYSGRDGGYVLVE